jgi:uncharacterized protein YidB (DUF937 family)
MGLLDGLIGSVLGSGPSSNQGQDPLGSVLGRLGGGNQSRSGNLLLQLALSMLQQNGGLEGILGKFRERGLSRQADSWVSTGQNMSISADQLQNVFGPSTISELASRLGVSEQQAGSEMAQVLPEVIDRLTPEGQVRENSDDQIAEGLSTLANSPGLR